MLALSDMSGRSIVHGFEEYLTGYPIPEADSYAFARTWYAPEMERPGCVWTHTLVVDNHDLGAVDDLSELEAAFRRPIRGANVDSYSKPLEIAFRTTHKPYLIPDTATLQTLRGLYETPHMPVVLAATNATSLQEIAVVIWNQQWAELRSSFAFCTGSISSRSVAGRPFDLQFVPVNAVREVRRDLMSSVVVDATMAPTVVGDEWLQVAAKDLTEPDLVLRGWFKSLGGSFDCAFQGRAAFEPLVQFVMSGAVSPNRPNSLEDFVGAVAKRFDSSDAARRLKIALVGVDAPLTRVLFPNRTEKDLLSGLATSLRPEAFNRDDLQVENRMRKLWTEQRAQAEQLVDHLLSRDHNIFGEAMLSTVISEMSLADVATLFRGRPSVLVSAIRRDPTVAMSPSIWSGQPDTQREVFDAGTAGLQITSEVINGIVAAMLDANSEAAVDQLFKRFGDSAVAGVLGWVAGNSGAQVSTEWCRVLRRYPATVLRWLLQQPKASIEVFALAAQVLDPHSQEVHQAGLDIWQMVMRRQEPSLADEGRIQLHAFILGLAFDFSTNQACELTVATFETVHEAAATRKLGYSAWSFFEQSVPYLSVFRNWDKCERLRRGLIDKFVVHDWPVAQFVESAQTANTLEELMRSCDQYSPSGKVMLKRMRQQKDSIRTRIPQLWWETIRSYL